MSQPTPKHAATITAGSLKLANPERFKTYLTGLWAHRKIGTAEIPVEIIVKKPTKYRSIPENNYYYGVVVKMISDETGSWPDDVHHDLKLLFLRIGGDKLPILRSTADLTPAEFEDYLSKIRMWAASFLNLIIPLPNEVL